MEASGRAHSPAPPRFVKIETLRRLNALPAPNLPEFATGGSSMKRSLSAAGVALAVLLGSPLAAQIGLAQDPTPAPAPAPYQDDKKPDDKKPDDKKPDDKKPDEPKKDEP